MGFPRCSRTRANSFFRSSGVSLFHRILANPDARAFLGVFFSGGPQRASAAAFIIELRFSGETLAQRFFAPFRPPALCRLLGGFSLDKSRVLTDRITIGIDGQQKDIKSAPAEGGINNVMKTSNCFAQCKSFVGLNVKNLHKLSATKL